MGTQFGGLRTITNNPAHSQIEVELKSEFTTGFLRMSEKDEQSFNVHVRTFKEDRRRYQIVAYALKALSTDINNWKPVLSAL